MPHLEFGALTLLLSQIAAILLVSRALGVVTRWLGQPMVIAEVIAGIALGPSLLGWLWPAGMAGLFPTSSLASLKMVSQLGLVLFMFLIGLELNPKLLRGRAHTSVFISHASIILPFVLGVLTAYGLHAEYKPAGVSFLSFALFLGVAMSVTAFPVLARILSERHLLDTRVGAITIACAAVDDVTAWCMLAFVVAIARAHAVTDAIWTTGLALVFIFFMLYVVRPFLGRLSAGLAGRKGLSQPAVAGILFLLVVSSALTEIIGIHALFGAFLFGAILPKENGLAESLAEKMDTVAVVLLLPLFFAFSGLRTQVGLVNEPRQWLVAGLFILVATLGKFGGSTLAARLTGLRWREASAIGILMNTRGLMELIVLNIGLDLGVISPTVFTMLVLMALVTTFGTTPILRWVYPDHELARDRLVATSEFPQGDQPPFTVVLGVSSGTAARGLTEVASALLGKRDQASRLIAVHLRPPAERLSTDLREGADEIAAPLLRVLAHGRERLIDVRPLSFVSTEPAVDLCRTAESKHASLVLVGSHKPLLLEGGFAGTVGEVLARSVSPVGVLIERGLSKVERVLFAYSTAALDAPALRVVGLLARYPGASVSCLGILPPGSKPGDEAEASRALLRALHEHEVAPVRMVFVEDASPSNAVVAEAARGYELIVIGSDACWALHTGLLSSREERSLAECPTSILVVHPGAANGANQERGLAAYRAPFGSSPSSSVVGAGV